MEQIRSERGSASCPDTYGEAREPKRTSNGRFAAGHSGNPSGRPPKAQEQLGTLLKRLLDEKVPARSPGGQIEMSIAEALLRQALVKAMDDPRLLFPLLKFLSNQIPEDLSGPPVEQEIADRHEAILDGYIQREVRKRQAGEPDHRRTQEENSTTEAGTTDDRAPSL